MALSVEETAELVADNHPVAHLIGCLDLVDNRLDRRLGFVDNQLAVHLDFDRPVDAVGIRLDRHFAHHRYHHRQAFAFDHKSPQLCNGRYLAGLAIYAFAIYLQGKSENPFSSTHLQLQPSDDT